MKLVVAAITGVDLDGHLEAIARTQSVIPFETGRFIHYAPGITREDYSRIVVKELASMIPEAYFVMLVQADGCGLHKERWSDEFLAYSYIGAPFPNGEVGNGGLSIRSRRFLEASAKMPTPDIPEDAFLCQVHRADMEKRGVKFAPMEVAHRFSHEHDICGQEWDIRDSWGAHGKWNLG